MGATRTHKRADTTERVDRVAETMQRTTAMIVAAIEEGMADPAAWSAPWHRRGNVGLPVNVATGATYQGGNLFLLWSLTVNGASRYWGTFNQWAEVTGADKQKPGEGPRLLKDGQKAAAYILRPRKYQVTDQDTGEQVTRVRGFSAHAVFHGDQIAHPGWTEPDAPTLEPLAVPEVDDIAAAFRWGALTGATIEESATAGASYSLTFDRVTMPARERFTSGHGCWSTLAHELTHWTGHENRLARDMGGRFGDDAYAAEELCAELGAAFTLAMIGRSSEPRADHAHYLASWLRVLKADPGALWTVAGKASKAAEYLTERAGAIGADVAGGLVAAV